MAWDLIDYPEAGTIFDMLSEHGISWINYHSVRLATVLFKRMLGAVAVRVVQDIRRGESFAAEVINHVMHGLPCAAVIVSPYARRDYVCTKTLDHTSVLKLIEQKWNLPPLTRRDAAADTPRTPSTWTVRPPSPLPTAAGPCLKLGIVVISRGFRGRRRAAAAAGRVPPGQYVTDGFPVLSAGPTPRTALDRWTFSITGGTRPKTWTWEEFRALPAEQLTTDIHCVTRWSKLDTRWEGVSVDVLLDQVGYDAAYVLAFCDGGYTTNLPLEAVTGGKAWVAFGYEGSPLRPEHGGPARLLVPRLYLWKSAKWVRGLRLRDTDEPGFWEMYGYHNYGDPWREQRYAGD